MQTMASYFAGFMARLVLLDLPGGRIFFASLLLTQNAMLSCLTASEAVVVAAVTAAGQSGACACSYRLYTRLET